MSDSEWDLIVTETAGFSGSDIATVVADALLEPIRELQHAIWWKPVIIGGEQKFVPCSSGDQGEVIKSTLPELPANQVTADE